MSHADREYKARLKQGTFDGKELRQLEADVLMVLDGRWQILMNDPHKFGTEFASDHALEQTTPIEHEDYRKIRPRVTCSDTTRSALLGLLIELQEGPAKFLRGSASSRQKGRTTMTFANLLSTSAERNPTAAIVLEKESVPRVLKPARMTIGFVSMPVTGHVNPMTALARKLQSRGNEVVFIGFPDAEPIVRAANL